MILGIDVGIKGALAFNHNDFLEVYDMPVTKRNKTSRVNCRALKSIIVQHNPDMAIIEQVNAFNMGATGAYNFGWNCGVIEAVLDCLYIPYEYVTPQVWKKALNCPKEKNGARDRASEIFPSHSDKWKLVKHDGRAEASLIAYYSTILKQKEK